jgi:hypothetical protein
MWRAIALRMSRSHASGVAPVAMQPVGYVCRDVAFVVVLDQDQVAAFGHWRWLQACGVAGDCAGEVGIDADFNCGGTADALFNAFGVRLNMALVDAWLLNVAIATPAVASAIQEFGRKLE